MESTIYATANILAFQRWLEASGRGFLQKGVDHLPVGDALLEIYRRAGVRGIRRTDSIAETLPLAMELIMLKVKPRRSGGDQS